jgi:hypothetical protein
MFRTLPAAPIFPKKNDIANGSFNKKSFNKKLDILNQFPIHFIVLNGRKAEGSHETRKQNIQGDSCSAPRGSSDRC